MLENHLIISPLYLSWDRPADFQRQICLILAKKNTVIVYLYHEPIFFLKYFTYKSQYPKIKNVIFYNPIYVLPFQRFRIIRMLNDRIAFSFLYSRHIFRAFTKKNVLLWIFDPFFFYLPVFAPKARSIYDCVDDICWKIRGKNNHTIILDEIKLIKNVTYFFVISLPLFLLKSKIRRPTGILTPGFSQKKFRNVMTTRNEKMNIVGFVGEISERINWKLLTCVILMLPKYQFKFYGPVSTGSQRMMERTLKKVNLLKNLPNVHFSLTQHKENEIGAIISSFSVGIIPYDTKIRANKYSYPLKAIEYLFLRKPVISTQISALKQLNNYIFCSEIVKDWVHFIKNECSKKKKKSHLMSKKEIMKKFSWTSKVEMISKHISASDLE